MPDQQDAPFRGPILAGVRAAGHKDGAMRGATATELPRLFTGVLPGDYSAICRVARAKHFDRGELLHSEGDPVRQVLLLTAGLVKITKTGPGGGEVILRLRMPGDVLGTMGLVASVHFTSAMIFRAARALVWDGQVFKDLVGRYPVLNQNMVAILGESLREIEARFCEVATERVGPRLALQLLRLLKTIGRPVDAAVEIALSREDLAQMTGTTLFTVSRLLCAWETRGVVRPRREAVAICDVHLLRAIAQGDLPDL
jgi:CRP-like cAMP-binding protein